MSIVRSPLNKQVLFYGTNIVLTKVRFFAEDKKLIEDKNRITKPNSKKNKKNNLETKGSSLNHVSKDVKFFQNNGDKNAVQAELLSKLLNHIKSTGENKSQDIELSDLLFEMPVEINKNKQDSFRGEYVRKTITGMKQALTPKSKPKKDFRFHLNNGSVNLFGDKGLNLFKESVFKDDLFFCSTWNDLERKELKIHITHPPANYFEEHILLTEQGKYWEFPINNEQGIEDHVDFSDHVFLEQHLQGWCPTKGPVRHFMELVCTGLSKNPYITAHEKLDHILWYKQYFGHKKELLKDLIVDASDNTC